MIKNEINILAKGGKCGGDDGQIQPMQHGIYIKILYNYQVSIFGIVNVMILNKEHLHLKQKMHLVLVECIDINIKHHIFINHITINYMMMI